MNGKKDCEKLMNALLPLAEKMLKQYRKFYPYGGYMKLHGEIVDVGAEDEDTEYPKSKDLIYVLQNSFSEMAKAGECIATAIVFDVRVNLPQGGKSDAIQVCLEHADGYSAEVFFPYEASEDGRITYGTTFAQKGEPRIFAKG